jgi:hypothetical protein
VEHFEVHFSILFALSMIEEPETRATKANTGHVCQFRHQLQPLSEAQTLGGHEVFQEGSCAQMLPEECRAAIPERSGSPALQLGLTHCVSHGQQRTQTWKSRSCHTAHLKRCSAGSMATPHTDRKQNELMQVLASSLPFPW